MQHFMRGGTVDGQGDGGGMALPQQGDPSQQGGGMRVLPGPAPGTGSGGSGGSGDWTQTFNSPLGSLLPQSTLGFNPGQFGGTVNNSQQQLGQLGQMLMSQANGGGPNLAAQQERQATDRNIAQQFALSQAGGGGAGATRNLVNNTGALDQQAAADSATQRMQQQLAAQQQLGQLDLGQLGTAGSLMTDQEKMALQQAQGNQSADMQGLGIGANLAGGVIGGIGSAAQGLAGGGGGSSGSSAAPYSGDPTYSPSDGSIGVATGGLISRHGVLRLASGGDVEPNQAGDIRTYDYEAPSQVGGGGSGVPVIGASGGSQSGGSTGKTVQGIGSSVLGVVPFASAFMGAMNPLKGPMSSLTGIHAPTQQQIDQSGGAAFTPGNGGFNPFNISSWFESGGQVGGRPEVAGDSGKNDTVPAMLSPGEIVLPRSITQDEDAAEKAKLFVDAIRKRHVKTGRAA